MKLSLKLSFMAGLLIANTLSFANTVVDLPADSFIQSVAATNGKFYRIYQTPDPTPINAFNKKYAEEVSLDGINWVETNSEQCAEPEPNHHRTKIYATSEGFYRFPVSWNETCRYPDNNIRLTAMFSIDGVNWTKMNEPAFDRATFNSLVVIGHKGASLYGIKRAYDAVVGETVESLQISVDRGQVWTKVGDLPAAYNSTSVFENDLAILDNGTIVLISGNQANQSNYAPADLMVSIDNGTSWTLNPNISINGAVLDYSQNLDMELIATGTKVALSIGGESGGVNIATEDGINWKSVPSRYGSRYVAESEFYDFKSNDGSLTLLRSSDLETYSAHDLGLTNISSADLYNGRYGVYTSGKFLMAATTRMVVIDDLSEAPAFTKFNAVESLKNSSGETVWVAKSTNEDRGIHAMAHSSDGLSWTSGSVYSTFVNGGFPTSFSGLTQLTSSGSTVLGFTQKQPALTAGNSADCIIRSYLSTDGMNWQWSENLPFVGCLVTQEFIQDSLMVESVKNPMYINGKFIAKTFVADTVHSYSSVDGVNWIAENSEIISAAARETSLSQFLNNSVKIGKEPNSFLYSRGNQNQQSTWHRSVDGLTWNIWSTIPLKNFGNASFPSSIIGSTRNGITALQFEAVIPDGATIPTDGRAKFYETVDDGVSWKGRAWPRSLPKLDFNDLLTGNSPTLQEIIHAKDESYQVMLSYLGTDTTIWYSDNHGASWGEVATIAQAVPFSASIRDRELEAGQLVYINGDNRINSIDLSGTYVPPVVNMVLSPDKRKQKLNETVSVSVSSESGQGTHEYTMIIKEVIADADNVRVYPAAGVSKTWQVGNTFSFIPTDLGLEVGKKYRVIVKVRDELSTKNRSAKTIKIIN